MPNLDLSCLPPYLPLEDRYNRADQIVACGTLHLICNIFTHHFHCNTPFQLVAHSCLQDESNIGPASRKRPSPVEGKPPASETAKQKTTAVKADGKKFSKDQAPVDDAEWWETSELEKVAGGVENLSLLAAF